MSTSTRLFKGRVVADSDKKKGESLLASTPVVVLSSILGRIPSIEEYNNAIIGILRAKKLRGYWYLSWVIKPNCRGIGYGKQMLKQFIKESYSKKFFAKIKDLGFPEKVKSLSVITKKSTTSYNILSLSSRISSSLKNKNTSNTFFIL